ncbi:hypothetical protein AK812_SmicGene5263 [Symbiodinium microadriaticum]|uniref:Uncharacterized protein n=1 Tax=Symbiodinium microadriaticum TaxID=2951 RepID=A0A1Q9EU50_SYMMI|nr:hypothetical protein AK812_SmicGene5263 [Symbiodinium microadriaticum]
MVNTLLVELVIWEMVNVAVHGDSIDNGEVIMSMLVAPTLAAVMAGQPLREGLKKLVQQADDKIRGAVVNAVYLQQSSEAQSLVDDGSENALQRPPGSFGQLTQEEFEIAVERLKQFEEAESYPPAAHPTEISPPPPQAPLCMPLRIIAVPLLVPVMPAQAIHQEAAPMGSPSSTPEYEHPGMPLRIIAVPLLVPVMPAQAIHQVLPLTFASDSESPTPRAVYYQPRESPVNSHRTDQVPATPRDLQLEECEEPVWSRSFTEGYCLPIQRTFIQFNTCEHVRDQCETELHDTQLRWDAAVLGRFKSVGAGGSAFGPTS